MQYFTTVLILFSSICGSAQSNNSFHFYRSTNDAWLSNTVSGFEENFTVTAKNSFTRDTFVNDELEIIRKSLISSEVEIVAIADQVPGGLHQLNLVKLDSTIGILGTIPGSLERIFFGQLNSDFTVDSISTIDVLIDGFSSLDITTLNVNSLNDATILVSGNYRDPSSTGTQSFYIDIDRNSNQIVRRSQLNVYTPLADVGQINDTLYVDHDNSFFLPPGSTSWMQEEDPGGLNLVHFRTEIETVGRSVYATGQEHLPDYRRGSLVIKMDDNLNVLAVDSLFLTQNTDSATYNSDQGLIVSPGFNRVIATGTTALQFSAGSFYNTELNEVYVAVYDTSLNHIFTKTLGGDAFYYNKYAAVINDHLVLTGFRYLREEDILEGYINITPLDEIVSNEDIIVNSEPLRVYPNPVESLFNVASENGIVPTDYVLYNINGQQVQFGRINPGQSVNCINLPPGTYVIKCLLEDGTLRTGKVIKVGQ